MQSNINSSKFYRVNTNLPSWLHNKPKKYVKHCVEKAKLGQEIPMENVKANGEIFCVTY